MTVQPGVSGLKQFGVKIAPVVEHRGKEAAYMVRYADDSVYCFEYNRFSHKRLERQH